MTFLLLILLAIVLTRGFKRFANRWFSDPVLSRILPICADGGAVVALTWIAVASVVHSDGVHYTTDFGALRSALVVGGVSTFVLLLNAAAFPRRR